MATTDDAAYAAVEAELRRNPAAAQDELWDKAKEASPGVAKLNRREFNARYPLQIKRKLLRESGGGAPRKRAAGAKKTGGKKRGRKGQGAAAGAAKVTVKARRGPGRPKGSGRKRTAVAVAATASNANREAIRQTLLSFATDVVSAAEQPKNLVKVLANVEKYVDRVIRAR